MPLLVFPCDFCGKEGCAMWYVLQVASGHEETACVKCRRAFREVEYNDIFIPEYVRMKRYLGAWHEETRILFPGYLFVDTDDAEGIEEALKPIPGIAKPVCIGGAFTPISREEEQFLSELMDMRKIVPMSFGYLVDGRVIVTQGPMQGKTSQIRRLDRHKRITEMAVLMWGKEKKVTMGLEIKAKVTGEEWEKMTAGQVV